MADKGRELEMLRETYMANLPAIARRAGEFRDFLKEKSDLQIFQELLFCLLTPQSKAKKCWSAVLELQRKNLLLEGGIREISGTIKCARFNNKKAEYIIKARNLFCADGRVKIRERLAQLREPFKARAYLADNVLGMGLKEASHFLRNIGLGGNLAILDRHILKNLEKLGVIDEIPASLTKKQYLETEEKMRVFSCSAGIPMDHLDILLWFRETKEIFK